MLPASKIDDPKDYIINLRFFRRFARLVIPYWTRQGSFYSWLTLGLCLTFAFGEMAVGAKLSYMTGKMTDALVNHQEVEYWELLAFITLIGFFIHGGLATNFFSFISDRLILDWRVWMTKYLMGAYLKFRTYFQVEQDGDIDNIDQRIQQEIEPFCRMAITLPWILLYFFSGLTIQGWVLISISSSLFYCVVIYGFANALVAWWIYQPVIRLAFDYTVSEADLRFGILHIRNYAETIALYRGESAEYASVNLRLKRVQNVTRSKLRYNLIMNSTLSSFSLLWTLVPVLILVPQYFNGKITFGTIAQATASAGFLLQSIKSLTGFLPMFAMAAPHVVRLAQIAEKAKAAEYSEKKPSNIIDLCYGKDVQVQNLTLYTPAGERTLLKNISLFLNPGSHLLITGQTGVGKSSLLRAMAGLWRTGEGKITMPSTNEVLFLPQRPYMLLGNLREQILYPATESNLTNDELQLILEKVSLPNIAYQHNGFDSVVDWSRILSLGEQQRVGFARALAARPRYVFLDESTSAVDISIERSLYNCLQDIGVTYISVGHRDSLLDYHKQILKLRADGSSYLHSIDTLSEKAPGRTPYT